MRVSVIIPTLNEESCLSQSLADLRRHRPEEIIVVDGGSADDTIGHAHQADLCLTGRRGRAWQMNLGADHARGDMLLFLHADCRLEPGALEDAKRFLHDKGVAAGCFTMSVQSSQILYRSIEACASARVRITGLAYGDQGLFLRKNLFDELGGFPPLRIMEDLYFSWKLRRQGKVVVLPRRIFVSPRRWQRVGIIRQSLRNWTLTALAAAGTHPDRLALLYPAIR